MTDKKHRILLVDDNPDDIHILMESLAGEFAVIAATSGEKAIEMATKSPHPDVILLDVNMPGIDGYETCRRLKSDEATRDIDIIFVSAQDSVEEILVGYEAGASDYLTKPVNPAELLQKIKLSLNNKAIRDEINSEKDMAMKTAMTAIFSAGEQGVVLDFMRRSFSVKSMDELAQLMVETTANFGLENSVQIRGSKKTVNFTNGIQISPLEQEILTRVKDAGRIREKGTNLVINFGPITQLIKNLPDDDDKRGRYRDHLALLLEGAEFRVKALEITEEIADVVQESNQALLDIRKMQALQKESAVRIMDDVLQHLEESFMSYGLSEEQEKLLLEVVQTGVRKSMENFEVGLKIDEKMTKIIERLLAISQK